MLKKLLFIVVVLAIMAAATVPLWTAKMAEEAFKNPENSMSAENVAWALKVRMYIYMYPEAGVLAEKAIIYFPESKEFPYFIYTAAMSAEKTGNHLAAIHWYGYFVELFPKHEWTAQAQNNYNKLKAIYATTAN